MQGLEHFQALPRSLLLLSDHRRTIPTPQRAFPLKKHLYMLRLWGCCVCKAVEVPNILMAAIRNAAVCTDREHLGQESFGFGCILQVAAAIRETDVLLQFLRTSNSSVRSWGTEG